MLLEDQDRGRWDPRLIGEGLALIDKAMRHRRRGPYQVQAADRRAARPRGAAGATPTGRGSTLLYAALERLQPSPVVTLNRAVAVAKVRGPAAALAMIEPLERAAGRAISISSARRGAFLLQLGRGDEAREAFDRAIALASHPAEAAHIRRHLDRLMREDTAPPNA